MGSPKDPKAPAKLPNSKSAAAVGTASLPEAAPSPWPANSADWAASAQAYYSDGVSTQPAFFLPIWGGQHLVPPYGTPIAYPAMCAPCAVYVHPSICPDMGYLAGESGKSMGAPDYFGEGGKATSGSGEEDASQSDGCVMDGSCDARDRSSGPKDEHKLTRERRKLHNRESSIRSRLRKQQKNKELTRKVAELNVENTQLRIELERLHKVCKDLEAENQHILEEISCILVKSS